MTDALNGACHCGAVKFEITAKPRLIVNCHCDSCRKRNGGAFSTYLAVAQDRLTITEGEDSLKPYVIRDVGEKHFCTECGSPVFNNNYAYPGLLMVFYGAIPHTEQLKPMFNVYCENQVDWLDNITALTSFAQGIEK